MRLDKDNVYFLPPDNKNGLSTSPPNRFDLCDKFEFIVEVKPDLEKLKEDYETYQNKARIALTGHVVQTSRAAAVTAHANHGEGIIFNHNCYLTFSPARSFRRSLALAKSSKY